MLDPKSFGDLAVNFGGSMLLAVLGLIEEQWGLVFQEAIRALISGWGLAGPL